MRFMCKSKIHHAIVTQAELNYIGSITIDEHLLEQANIVPYEQVHVINLTNGTRYITYALAGDKHSGVVCINGAGARLVQPGDKIFILSYEMYSQEDLKDFRPINLFMNEDNTINNIG